MNTQTRALQPAEVASLLDSMRAAVLAETGALPEEVLGWHPGEGEWCVKECIGHMVEAERRGFGGRIRFLLETDDGNPPLSSWDQVAVARARNDCAQDSSALLEEFRSERAANVEFVARLRPEDLA